MAPEPGDGVDTLLVGVDAACPAVLERLDESEVIPNLSAFMERATTRQLDSQLPPWTPSAWPSLYTGVNPGKHGVYGFLRFDGYDWDVVDYTDVRDLSLWELLGEHDRSSVVVNVPVTHPPNPFPGAIVPGYVAPDEPTCHPRGLLEDLQTAVPEYSVYPTDASSRDRQLEHYREAVTSRVDAYEYLRDRFDPDFGFVQFQACDSVFHQYPDDWDAVEAVYESVDDAVGRLLSETTADTVVVASDHGMGEYDGYEFRVNEYLADHGFVESIADGAGMPSWSSLARERLRHDDDGLKRGIRSVAERGAHSVAARGAQTAAGLGLTADRVYHALEQVGIGDAVASRLPTDVVRSGTRRVDFAASTAYVRDRIELGVRLNLDGREPDGVVPPDAYATVRSTVKETLEQARTPDGDPVFDAVLPREAVFHGPHVSEAPDLVVIPSGFDQFLSASMRGEQFAQPSESWNHKFTGVLAIDGPEITDDAVPPRPNILDVAPTICAALDVPASDRMDGTTLGTDEPYDRITYPEHGQATAANLTHVTGHSPTQHRQRPPDDVDYLEDAH